ncbi:glycoside hydrolase family protein, partial [mine drainage metagenome]
MDRFVCIHGHFYQPPRENPWLERVEVQDSAAPYHDWNERITAECYAPNTRSRIMDPEGRTLKIVNNFASISFDVGPTLLSWLESEAPEVYERILTADRESRRRFGGHGSAMAQSFNHTILPLASEDDRRLQIRWGLMDFESRFGRPAEGMWLPETAVNTPVLESLAEAGVEFTVLAPTQAQRIRPLSGGEWTDVSGGRIDPSTVYRARLPSGRTIDLFFYDGPISHALAFERLLDSGEAFADRLDR